MAEVLFINGCVRKDSRTRRLADDLLKKLGKPYDEVILEEITFPKVDEEYLNLRDALITCGDFNNPMFSYARAFSEAEIIVVAAPYWDLSFPASLKQYLEIINVVGITFQYSEAGVPIGLCKAKKLYYVTTAGGNYIPEEFGFGYVKALAQNYYGIEEVQKIEVGGLDIQGANVKELLESWETKLFK